MIDTVLIGSRIRVARQAKGLTLRTVAAAVALTQGYLSKVERDQVSPSVASLLAICRVVGLRVGDLFDPPPSAIVRAGDGARINFGAERAQEFVITPGNQTQIEVIQSFIEPGGTGGATQYVLDCDTEFVFVITGSLDVLMGDDVFALSAGDAMTFEGRKPHTWRNPSTELSSHVLWVLTPAP